MLQLSCLRLSCLQRIAGAQKYMGGGGVLLYDLFSNSRQEAEQPELVEHGSQGLFDESKAAEGSSSTDSSQSEAKSAEDWGVLKIQGGRHPLF